jgi:hypothetical protein
VQSTLSVQAQPPNKNQIQTCPSEPETPTSHLQSSQSRRQPFLEPLAPPTGNQPQTVTRKTI